MDKREITGSEFSDTNLEYQVCSHLRPILDLLASHGNSYDPSAPLYTDKGGGHTGSVTSHPIDFELIERTFEIPSFIELNRRLRSVVCRRCWCAIAESV